MSETIDCTCGIYDAEYKLIRNKDGSISVRAPYIKWSKSGGTGSLAHRVIGISEEDKDDVIAFFDEGELTLDANNNCGVLTLDDVLEGRRGKDVHVEI